MKTVAGILTAFVVLAGCSPAENAKETKASDVKLNISQEQQDQLAKDLSNFTPDKKK
jgi:hypothetical protein